jgi:response regulator of citrate/malate metabolism
LGAFDYIVKPLDLDYLERSLWYTITAMTLRGQRSAISSQLSAKRAMAPG